VITKKENKNMKAVKNILALSAVALLLLSAPGAFAQGMVDANGDGICDITGQPIGTGAGNGQGQQGIHGNANGPHDGTGNQGNGPQDGTGYGAQSGKNTGPQDGTQARIGQANGTGSGSSATGNRGRKGGRR
jgi:hypothetical protein